MININADQLGAQLQESLFPCYLLFGNEQLLIQESQDMILYHAEKNNFHEHFSVRIESNTDWQEIFSLCKTRSLFSNRQIMLIILPDGSIQDTFNDKFMKLTSMLHEDLLLILRGSKLTYSLAHSVWFKKLSQRSVIVKCALPEKKQLPVWVASRAKKMNLTLDDDACHLLCYCYEGNLLALVQVLEQLSLHDQDKNITLNRVHSTVHNAAHFTAIDWIEAMLLGKSQRAVHILRQLQRKDEEPVILLRQIQRSVLQLLILKRKITATSLKKKVNYSHSRNICPMLTQSLGRLTLNNLQDAVTLMLHIELSLKQDYRYLAWSDLNSLAMILCGKSIL